MSSGDSAAIIRHAWKTVSSGYTRTVVFVIAKWQPDAAGEVLEFRSRWTTVLGSGSRTCRTSSGNVERVRVRRQGDAWTAEALMPVMHGDTVCEPIR